MHTSHVFGVGRSIIGSKLVGASFAKPEDVHADPLTNLDLYIETENAIYTCIMPKDRADM